MSAVAEALWSGVTANNKIRRYDIADGRWSDIMAWTPQNVLSRFTMFWDGAYHLWISEWYNNINYNKRINIVTQVAEDFPVASPIQITLPRGAQNYGSRLYWPRQSTPYISTYDYTTKQWASTPDPPAAIAYGGQVGIPPWATNDPGKVFVTGGAGKLTFYSYDQITDAWTTETDLDGNIASGGGDLAWSDASGTEYIYCARTGTDFDKYNVNTGVWARIGDMPNSTLPSYLGGNNLVWDGDNYLFYQSDDTDYIYRFDLNTETWDAYLACSTGLYYGNAIAYTPRIRFIFLDPDGDRISAPVSLGSVPKLATSIPVQYYLKALEAEAGDVTIGILVDGRTDADDIIQIADDVAGSPGAWGVTVNKGSFNADESKPFWFRTNPPAGVNQEAKVARLQLTIS